MRKSTKKTKRQKRDGRDRLSDLPDCVLLHVMKFMDTKHAVQTCVLSKRWKDLWKFLTSLSFSRDYFYRNTDYYKFVSWVLSGRDVSISLTDLDVWACGSQSQTLLTKVAKYVVLHKTRRLTIDALQIPDRFFSRVFSSDSLTFLKLSAFSLMPKSLPFPALKSLHLENVLFTGNDDGCADPFSASNSLNTLVITRTELSIQQEDVKVLCISNSNLCSLTLVNTTGHSAHGIALSAPKLRSLYVICDPIYQLSVCNLSSLEQVKVDVKKRVVESHLEKSHLALVSFLQVLADYVKTLILCSSTLEILNDLSSFDLAATLIPRFARLKSLKLKWKSSYFQNSWFSDSNISDEGASRIMNFLLRKS